MQIFNLLMEDVQCNCDLGDKLQMAPNLISHHLSKLRAAGLVDVERSSLDARWLYFSVNREALNELNAALSAFFDPERIQPRDLSCGPKVLSGASQGYSTRANTSKTDLLIDKVST